MIFNITNKSVIREFGYKRLIELVPADLLYPKLTVKQDSAINSIFQKKLAYRL